MRHVTAQGIRLIRSFEGFSAKPYLCPAGYFTIGYGHVLRPGEQRGASVTPEQAAELLAEDILAAEAAVALLVATPLTDGQFDALVSFAFNLGAGALQRSTLRRKLNRREYASAAAEFPRWAWAAGRKLPGLLRRREAERERFLTVVFASQSE